MKKINSSGFTAVEILLVVLIFLVAGFAGYYVYNSQKKSKPTAPVKTTAVTTTQTNTSAEPAKTVDAEAQGWTLFTSGKNGYTVRVPDGWQVIKYKPSNAMRSQSITYAKGTPAKIEEAATDYAGDSFPRFAISQYAKADNFSGPDSDATKTEFTAGNIKGTRYYKKYPVEKPQGVGPYPGMENYTYTFEKNGVTTYVTYNIFNANQYMESIINLKTSDPNQVSTVERMLQTLVIN